MSNWNTGWLLLSEELQNELKFSFDKAQEGTMHVVNLLCKDVITDEIIHRYGYFDYKTEAEIYAKMLAESQEKPPAEYLILIDGEIYGGKMKTKENSLVDVKIPTE